MTIPSVMEINTEPLRPLRSDLQVRPSTPTFRSDLRLRPSGQTFASDLGQIAAKARHAQPARNNRPPIGVTAPRIVTPVTASRYKLPEKNTIPATKHQPAV